jgi:hypothetical protein
MERDVDYGYDDESREGYKQIISRQQRKHYRTTRIPMCIESPCSVKVDLPPEQKRIGIAAAERGARRAVRIGGGDSGGKSVGTTTLMSTGEQLAILIEVTSEQLRVVVYGTTGHTARIGGGCRGAVMGLTGKQLDILIEVTSE